MNAAFENISIVIRQAIERTIEQETRAGKRATPDTINEALYNDQVQRIANKAAAEGREITPDEQAAVKDRDHYRDAINDFYNAFFYKGTDGSGKVLLHSTVVRDVVADYISEHYPYIIIDGLFYIYENGYYIRDTKDNAKISLFINNLIRPEYQSRNRTAEVITALRTPDHIISPAEISQKTNCHELHYICFRNGVYDPKEQKMLPHDPKYRFLNQIPRDYDPKSDPAGDAVESFFQSANIAAENRTMLLTYIGLCLTTDTRLQKMLVLKGRPGTGKSQLLNLIKYIVGEQNCASEPLEALNENRFRAYNVLGKLCNINADLTTEGSIDPAVIKQLIGEDTLPVERKGVDAISITPYAKHLFSMNNYPVIKAKDASFYRRVMILPVDTIPAKTDQMLQEKLRSQADYLLRLAVMHLEAYYATPSDERGYIESPDSKRLVQEWRYTGDSVSAFLAEEKPFQNAQKIKRETLFKSYSEYCDREGREPLKSSTRFYNAMKAEGYIENKTSINGETGVYCFFDPHQKEPGFKTAEKDETPFG